MTVTRRGDTRRLCPRLALSLFFTATAAQPHPIPHLSRQNTVMLTCKEDQCSAEMPSKSYAS